jgi:hypothetical protein
MVGEKRLVIGKTAKPRCLKNLKINTLPVIWRNNKKAWMTAAIMEEWLITFNAKIEKENRNAIIFLDNATCHAKVTLLNVKSPGSQQMQQVYYNLHGYGCYLHIQIALQMISDAIFDSECRRSQ